MTYAGGKSSELFPTQTERSSTAANRKRAGLSVDQADVLELMKVTQTEQALRRPYPGLPARQDQQQAGGYPLLYRTWILLDTEISRHFTATAET